MIQAVAPDGDGEGVAAGAPPAIAGRRIAAAAPTLGAAHTRDAAHTLDHVGIVGRDLPTLAASFEAFGFHLAPLARHAGGRTANRCVMLCQGYIELLATIDGGVSATLDRFLGRHAGAHLLAFGITDEQAVRERLLRAGIMVPAPHETDRAVDDTDPDGPRARFRLLTPDDQPTGRFHLIRHLTPDLVWQEPFLRHPNRAVMLAEAILLAADPAEPAAFLSRLSGRSATPDPLGGYALALPRGTVRLLPARAVADLLAHMPVPSGPSIAALTLRTDDGTAALRARLDARAIPHRIDGPAVLVAAAGVVLRFL